MPVYHETTMTMTCQNFLTNPLLKIAVNMKCLLNNTKTKKLTKFNDIHDRFLINCYIPYMLNLKLLLTDSKT